MARAFFLGAGASKADGFPLTRELLWAVAQSALRDGRGRGGNPVRRFLQTVFQVPLPELRAAARAWQRFLRDPDAEVEVPNALPHLTDVLSTLDILRDEEGCLGLADGRRPLGHDELSVVRAEVVRAIATGFKALHEHRRRQRDGFVAEQFVQRLSGNDVLITTNWDILLDIARDARFGTTELDYGTRVSFEKGARSRGKARPQLLKLHGSLNWLVCPRCSRLWAEIDRAIAFRAYDPRAKRETRGQCDCEVPLEALLVTPTFVKSYRNLHLLNVWNAALHALAACREWVFLGYSLPDDDIHIKTLLLKARRMRAEQGGALAVTAVLAPRGAGGGAERARYERFFPGVDVREVGFAGYVQKGMGTQPRARSAGSDGSPRTGRRRPATRRKR